MLFHILEQAQRIISFQKGWVFRSLLDLEHLIIILEKIQDIKLFVSFLALSGVFWFWYLQNALLVLMQLSRECRAEVQRILHQRAMDVKLDPALQDKCLIDLGKWCSEKTETGQVGDIIFIIFMITMLYRVQTPIKSISLYFMDRICYII